MTRVDAFGNAGADDMLRSTNGASIAARANGANDVIFDAASISTAITSVYLSAG
jgi:hypothetical protein